MDSDWDDTFADGVLWALSRVWASPDRFNVGHPEEETVAVQAADLSSWAAAAGVAHPGKVLDTTLPCRPTLRARPSGDLLTRAHDAGRMQALRALSQAAQALLEKESESGPTQATGASPEDAAKSPRH